MKIGELFVQLGIKVDQERIARFQRGIKDLRTNIIAVQAAFVDSAVDSVSDSSSGGTAGCFISAATIGSHVEENLPLLVFVAAAGLIGLASLGRKPRKM